ncbi:hypothetical protein [Streptomyces sp. NPDC089919]|uniref:hypothetical protein n=1 Tax=Streptomyces sp. NPDC089919 TaxID=3155188 RepID=UPI00343A9AEA
MNVKNTKNLSAPVKRVAAALSLAGAALGLAATGAQAAPLPDLPPVPLAGMPDITQIPTAGVPDLSAVTQSKLPPLPGNEVTARVTDVVQHPDEAMEQAEVATVAADEALGTTLAGSGPALTPPLQAVQGVAEEGLTGL